MMDPACAAPQGGALSGEQPEERPKMPEMESERLNVKPKRQRERNGESDRPDNAVKTLCTSCCTCQQPNRPQQQPQPQQQQRGRSSDGKAPQDRR